MLVNLKGYNDYFLLSPRWPLWRGSTIFKNTMEVENYHVHLHETFLNLQLLFFFFKLKRRTKICLEQGWSRSSGVHEWLQQ